MTLYEVDDSGWVHRQVQLSAEGTRFAPEDILMCSPVNTAAMVEHPATEEIAMDEFELLWGELSDGRAFVERIPDPRVSWEGWIEHARSRHQLAWLPSRHAGPGWSRVPGFAQLFVRGDRAAARAASAAIFVGRPVHWTSMALAA
jgi:hypothetical protein